jgi:drug/metabolite transporter (DMT)-like permease
MKAPRSIEDATIFAAPGLFVLFWASGYIGGKLGLQYAEPATFLSVRMIAVVLLLAAIIAATKPIWPTRAGVLHNVVAGLLVHGIYLGGVFYSLVLGLPAGLTALVLSLQPVLTSTLANRLLGERVIPRQWVGLLLGIVGVALVVHGKTGGDTQPAAWAWAVVALVSITIGTLYQKRFGGAVDWRTGLLIQYAACVVLYGLAALLAETRTIQWTAEFIFALSWLVFVLSFGAIWLLYFLIRRTAATRLVSLFYLTPPVTALMAWAMFNERLAPLALLGGAVCLAGVFLVNWRLEAAR